MFSQHHRRPENDEKQAEIRLSHRIAGILGIVLWNKESIARYMSPLPLSTLSIVVARTTSPKRFHSRIVRMLSDQSQGYVHQNTRIPAHEFHVLKQPSGKTENW